MLLKILIDADIALWRKLVKREKNLDDLLEKCGLELNFDLDLANYYNNDIEQPLNTTTSRDSITNATPDHTDSTKSTKKSNKSMEIIEKAIVDSVNNRPALCYLTEQYSNASSSVSAINRFFERRGIVSARAHVCLNTGGQPYIYIVPTKNILDFDPEEFRKNLLDKMQKKLGRKKPKKNTAKRNHNSLEKDDSYKVSNNKSSLFFTNSDDTVATEQKHPKILKK